MLKGEVNSHDLAGSAASLAQELMCGKNTMKRVQSVREKSNSAVGYGGTATQIGHQIRRHTFFAVHIGCKTTPLSKADNQMYTLAQRLPLLWIGFVQLAS